MNKLDSYLSGIVLATALLFNSNAIAGQLPDLGSEFRSAISIKDERLIGQYYMSQIRAANMVYPDPIVNEYVTYIGNQLAPYMEVPYPNMRLNFFAVQDKTINAFAFFGGNIAINSGLILLCESDSELAGVMAHELAHIAQQHLIRHIADSKRLMPLTLAGTLAAVLIGQPDLVIPVLAGHMQRTIDFTRQQEQEADRIGMKILSQAGFDPQGLPNILERMSLALRYHGKPPEYLLTHPLYESRISDTRHRASTFSYKKPKYGSHMFELLKVRIAVQSENNIQQLTTNYLYNLNHNSNNVLTSQYGYAYALLKKGNVKDAWKAIDKLASHNPDDLIIQSTAAEIEERNLEYAKAKARLERLLLLYPDSPSLLKKYSEFLLQLKQPLAAKKILARYKELHSPDPAFYELIRQTEGMLGNKVAVYEANAEWYFLNGDLSSALAQLDLALAAATNDKTKAHIKTRQQQIIAVEQDLKRL